MSCSSCTGQAPLVASITPTIMVSIEPANGWLPFNANIKPPGGWGGRMKREGYEDFFIHVKSPEEAVAEVMRHFATSDCPVTKEEAQDIVSQSYCSRPGLICPMKSVPDPNAEVIEYQQQPTFTPEKWGAFGWGMLHLFGTETTRAFRREEFFQYLSILDSFLSAPITGCPECHEHFSNYLKSNNPEAITTAEEAAVWSWRFHDSVNERIGKPRLTFEQAAKMWNWKTS